MNVRRRDEFAACVCMCVCVRMCVCMCMYVCVRMCRCHDARACRRVRWKLLSAIEVVCARRSQTDRGDEGEEGQKEKKSSEGELRQDYVPSKEPYLVNKLTAYRVYLSGEFNPSSTHKTLLYLLLSPHV